MKDYDKKNAVYKYNDDEFKFDFYTSLPISKKSEFVNNLSYLLVGDNYKVVLKDILFDLLVVDIFTNVDISHIMFSETMIDDAEEFLSKTNIVEIVKSNVENGVIEEIENAINLNIEYRTGIHRNVISDSIANLVDTIERKIGDFDIDTSSMIEMAELLTSISGELTMDKMLDAYSKSDMYKNNHKDNSSDTAS